MASISNLAVIISGQTAPLEASLKKAKSEVSSFSKGISSVGSGISSSIGHGLGIGLGVMGLDNIEKAIKKAIAASPGLAEASEKIETNFGQAFVNITKMEKWLPEVSKIMEEIANGDFWDDLKRRAHVGFWSLLGQGEQAKKEAGSMLALSKATKEVAAEKERLAKIEAERMKARHIEMIRQDVGSEEQLEFLKDLQEENKKLNKNYETEQLQRMRQDYGESNAQRDIEEALQLRETLKLQNKQMEENERLMEDGKKLTQEYETELEKFTREMQKVNDMYRIGAVGADTYNRATEKLNKTLANSKLDLFGMIRDVGEELKKKELEDFLGKGKQLLQDQIPEIEKYRKEYERAQKLFKEGKIDAAGVEAFRKQLASAEKFAQGDRLAGATSGAEAYSAIVQAQAAGQDKATEQKMLKETENQSRVLKAIEAHNAKMANGGAFLQMKLLSTKGVS